MKKTIKISYIFFLFVAVLLVGSSCKKDKDDATPTFELRFTNTSENPYRLEIDGTSSIISGKTFKNLNLKKGTYAYKITQQSGYLLFPTIIEGTINLDQTKEIIFP